MQPHHIVIAGDSAGGGLALSALLSLRDAGDPLPAGAAIISPSADLALTGESMTTRAEADPWLTPQFCERLDRLYVSEAEARHPLASPVYADFHGLPPLLIHVGSDEILLDDSTRVAEQAQAAGVEVKLDIWEGMWHVWYFFAPVLPEGQQAIEQIGQFIRQKTGLTSMAAAVQSSA